MFGQDCNGQIGGGGVSVYYSHTLQLLCFSYSHGKSFLAPLVSISKWLCIFIVYNTTTMKIKIIYIYNSYDYILSY